MVSSVSERDSGESGEREFVFFVKQKTAYEMLRSLVGSEMCIRDRGLVALIIDEDKISIKGLATCGWKPIGITKTVTKSCLLYTSDAADDLLCVDLGGRRIIKKKHT